MATVRYSLDNLPEVSPEDWARVDAVKDEDIDFSDIPEQTGFSRFAHPVNTRLQQLFTNAQTWATKVDLHPAAIEEAIEAVRK